jgi:hypothetical protein
MPKVVESSTTWFSEYGTVLIRPSVFKPTGICFAKLGAEAMHVAASSIEMSVFFILIYLNLLFVQLQIQGQAQIQA